MFKRNKYKEKTPEFHCDYRVRDRQDITKEHIVKWEDILYFYDNLCKGKKPSKKGKVWVDPRYNEKEAFTIAGTLGEYIFEDGYYIWDKPKEKTTPPPKQEYKKDRLWWQDELNLSDQPSLDEIKKNYRELVKRFHPDTGGVSEKFQSIVKAYESANNYVSSKNN